MGQAVGYLILRGLSDRHDAIEVKLICLTDRGSGIGSTVFAALLPWAFRERGAHRLWLGYVENTRARRLYERPAFREEGRMRECVKGPDGGYRTLILMSICAMSGCH